MGEGESATTERPFQSIKAVERTSPKLRICERWCRIVAALRLRLKSAGERPSAESIFDSRGFYFLFKVLLLVVEAFM